MDFRKDDGGNGDQGGKFSTDEYVPVVVFMPKPRGSLSEISLDSLSGAFNAVMAGSDTLADDSILSASGRFTLPEDPLERDLFDGLGSGELFRGYGVNSGVNRRIDSDSTVLFPDAAILPVENGADEHIGSGMTQNVDSDSVSTEARKPVKIFSVDELIHSESEDELLRRLAANLNASLTSDLPEESLGDHYEEDTAGGDIYSVDEAPIAAKEEIVVIDVIAPKERDDSPLESGSDAIDRLAGRVAKTLGAIPKAPPDTVDKLVQPSNSSLEHKEKPQPHKKSSRRGALALAFLMTSTVMADMTKDAALSRLFGQKPAAAAECNSNSPSELRVQAGEWVRQQVPHVLDLEQEVESQIQKYIDFAVCENAKILKSNLTESNKKEPRYKPLLPIRQIDTGMVLPLIMLTSGGSQWAEPPVFAGQGLAGIGPETGSKYVDKYNYLNDKHNAYASVAHLQQLLDKVDTSKRSDLTTWFRAAILGANPGEGYFADQAENEWLAAWLPLIINEWTSVQSDGFNKLSGDPKFQQRKNAAINDIKENSSTRK